MTNGAIVQRSWSDRQHDLIDATPETPFEVDNVNDAFEGVLPIGRTFADVANGICITALSEIDTSATVEVVRDPDDQAASRTAPRAAGLGGT